MSFVSPFRFRHLIIAAALLLFAPEAGAQGPAASRQAASAELTITATVVPALYIQLSAASDGAQIMNTAGPASMRASTLDLGDVNGMGTGNPAAGVSVRVNDQSGAVYTTPITLTPYFSGFSSTTATLSVVQDQSSGLGSLAEVREGSSAAAASNVSATAPRIITSTATSGSPIKRYVGLFVKTGADNSSVGETLRAKLIYEITVH